MTTINPVSKSTASQGALPLLEAVEKKLGMIPNLFAVMAHSPDTLQSYLGLSENLEKGQLSAIQRESIALAVAQVNSCHYCLSAHTAISKMHGMSPDSINLARKSEASNVTDSAILKFATKVTQQRGHVAQEDVNNLLELGVSNQVILEVIAHVALNTLTNYVNNVAKTEIDFPVVEETV